MCRREQLLQRAENYKVLSEKIKGSPLKGYDSVIKAIESNEEQNLVKAKKMLDLVYKPQLEKELAEFKLKQASKEPIVVSTPKPTVQLTERPRSPPIGLTPEVKNMSPQSKDTTLAPTLSRGGYRGKRIEVEETVKSPTSQIVPIDSKKVVESKKVESKPVEVVLSSPKTLTLTGGQKAGLILMDSNSPFVYCGLTSGGQVAILNAHNVHRRKFAVYDPGVKDLVWSTELAKTSQAYAEKLVLSNAWAHSTGRGDAGENLANLRGTDVHSTRNPQEVVDAWYNEIHDFNFKTQEPLTVGKMVGHFTQVVSRRSTQMGAGVAKSTGGYEVWVCQYSPAGNMTINDQQTNFDLKKITLTVFNTIKKG
jgi:pathogenesis-related protein 1